MKNDKLIKAIISQRIIRNSFRKNLRAYFKEQNLRLNANELLTLYYVSTIKNLTQKEMSVYLDYDLATAGRILDSLAKKGLIDRTRSNDDGRRNDLELTKKGEDLINGIHDHTISWYKKTIKPLENKLSGPDEQIMNESISIAKQLTKNWDGTKEW